MNATIGVTTSSQRQQLQQMLCDALPNLFCATTTDQLQSSLAALRQLLGAVAIRAYLVRGRERPYWHLSVADPAVGSDESQLRMNCDISAGKKLSELDSCGVHPWPEDNILSPMLGVSAADCCLHICDKNNSIGVLRITGVDSSQIKALKTDIQRFARQIFLHLKRIQANSTQNTKQESLTHLVKDTFEVLAYWSKKKGWHYYNQHILYRLGYDPETVPLHNIFGNPSAMTKEDWASCQNAIKQCLHSKAATQCEVPIVSSSGVTHYLQCKLKPVAHNEMGDVCGMVGILVDMTENHAYSQSVAERTELDSWLLELNNKLFRHCDRASVEQGLQEFGMRFGLDRVFLRLYQPEGYATVFAEWTRAGNIPISQLEPQFKTVTPSDTINYFIEDSEHEGTPQRARDACARYGIRSAIYIPLFDDNNFLGYFSCQSKHPMHMNSSLQRAAQVIADSNALVVARERILSKLESSKERFQLAMQAASYGLWELNLLNQTVYLSPTYYTMLGYQGTPPSGFSPLRVDNIHIDDKQSLLDITQQLATGEMEEFCQETRHITLKGDILWVLMGGKIIKRDDTGRPLRAMGTLTDITNLKKAQADLELAHQEAISAHHAKSEFLARMSHEIRTPMNAIIGMAYLTLQSELSDEQRSYVEDIDTASKSLLQIIDDILDFSKIEAGKLIIDNHTFNLIKHIDRITSRYDTLALHKQLDFSVHIDSQVPKYICADSTRVRQVLVNLLNNAFKFTDRGEVKITIDCTHQNAPNLLLRFSIRDTGIGLSQTEVQRLFAAFTQADGSSSRQYGGTGLGLAISKQLANLMGGDISVTSTPGVGSEFCFTITGSLPQEQSAESEKQHTLIPVAQRLQNKRVLLVEDNKVNQKVASAILRQQAMQVTLANNGTEAVYIMKASEQGAFDFVLMDIEMPYMGGLEATAGIRKLARHDGLPIIGMTAHTVNDNKTVYLAAGMTDCISKPIAPSALYKTLEQHLS